MAPVDTVGGVYSCACFETPETTLDAAQEAKLDLMCRKLGLQPGMRLLDIGCGWGSLVIFATERYGVEATGITLYITAARRGFEDGSLDVAQLLLARPGSDGPAALPLCPWWPS